MSIPNVRGTFNLIRSQEKWQILSVHMSVPFTEQNEGESFPLQKMKQQYSKLENMVEERTAELKRVNDELRASNAAKDKFFSIIAHDLKSPFNTLLGFTELLTEDFDDFDEEDKKSILQAMHKSTGRIYNLTENLLVWARSQLKSVRFNPGVIELHNLVRDCQDHVQEMADKKQILIHNHVENGIKVFGDQYMLSTVMRNLLSNALKFTPENGKVRVCAEIHKSLSNESIKVMVDDTGIGIPESEIQEVFTVSKSVSKPGTNNEKGTGLGLAICKDFISFHKSDIHAENLPEKGSRFWFLLQPVE
jgi:signal transduction histidine kinase